MIKAKILGRGRKKGFTVPEEVRRRISLTHRANGKMKAKRPPHTAEHTKAISDGIKRTWDKRGRITPINTRIRNSTEYKAWRTAVFERDNYTCQICKVRGVYFHADHIKEFSKFPELRMELSNGRTLCVPCHRKTHSWGGKGEKKQRIRLFTKSA